MRDYFKKWISNLKNRNKGILLGVAALITFLCILLSGIINQFLFFHKEFQQAGGFIVSGNTMKAVSFNPIECLKYSVKSPAGILVLLIIFVVAGFLAYTKIARQNILGVTDIADERGVSYSKKKTYGSAKFQDPRENIAEIKIEPISSTKGVILGGLDVDGKECVVISDESPLNKNIAIYGSPGTGKSVGFVKTNIIQLSLREESIIITDPKGELYVEMGKYLESKGYVVKVFNLKEPSKSDSWDCLSEIFDKVTGEVDLTRADEFVTIVMDNTSDGKKEDAFWKSGASNLLKAVVLHVAYNFNYELRNSKFQDILTDRQFLLETNILGFNTGDFMNNVIKNENIPIKEVKRQLFSLCELVSKPVTDDEYKQRISSIQCSFGEVVKILSQNRVEDIDKIFETRYKGQTWHPAMVSYTIYLNGPPATRPNFLQGLTIRLNLLQNPDTRLIVSNPDIDMELPGTTKCAYFCIIPDQTKTMMPISSLFFSFLFKDLSDAADRKGPSTRLPVNFIMDEFPNIGKIPDFSVKMSTLRSRKINIVIIFQAIGQLWEMFEKNLGEVVLGCCDTQILLGCNDGSTAKHISDRSGEATISVESKKDDIKVGGPQNVFSDYGVSFGDGKRNLLTPNEVITMNNDDCVVALRGKNIMKLKKVRYYKHPEGKDMKKYTCTLDDYPLSKEKYNNYIDAFTV